MNIYQNNIYRIDLGWLHLDNEARYQKNDWQSYIPGFVPYPNIILVTSSTNPVMKTVLHARSYNRFIVAPSNLRRKKLHERMNAPIFLEAALTKETL